MVYPLTCRSFGSTSPYIMCECRWETISSVKMRERGDFIRFALWHTSAIQTQAWHILCTEWEKHQFNTNIQMQTPDLRYLFPWHSSVHTLVCWTDSQGSCTNTLLLGEQLNPWRITKCHNTMQAGKTFIMQTYFTEKDGRLRIFILS